MRRLSNVAAQDKILNLYSSRHYQTDEALYANFTKQTGIRINRIEAPEDALIERLRNEGAAAPPTCSSPSMPGGCGAPSSSGSSSR
jgi:hypothetical protein